VVADYTRQGTASVMNLTAIPVRFSCWSHLAVTQALLSCDHASFKGHLSGVLAGLLHVFLPKAGVFMVRTEHVEQNRKDKTTPLGVNLTRIQVSYRAAQEQGMYHNCMSMHDDGAKKRAMNDELLLAVSTVLCCTAPGLCTV